jgi:hypothetical protein
MVNYVKLLASWTKSVPAAMEHVSARPPHWLGDEWTPSLDQIAEARKRLAVRRNATQWRRVGEGAELDALRTAIVCATDFQRESDWNWNHKARLIRSLVFEKEAKFFARSLVVSPVRYLIEFRHPSLQDGGAGIPIGLRFIGLVPQAWRQEDQVGVMLDGSQMRLSALFGSGWKNTFRDANLSEAYVHFVLDNVEFSGGQYYLVSCWQDFVACHGLSSQDDDFKSILSAQYRVTISSANDACDGEKKPTEGKKQEEDTKQKEDKMWQILGVPEEVIVPPTWLRTIPAADERKSEQAIVFSTIVHKGQFYHVCWAVSNDGRIEAVAERLLTPEKTSLPVVPMRSFAEQRDSIVRIIGADETHETA